MANNKNLIQAYERALAFNTVFSLFESLGLDVVTSDEFKNAIYKKAEKDVGYWFAKAPHGLGGDANEY
jgi:predicted nucleotide-binding protein (sugar kinase/HSP70/actin superfamily)